MLIQPVAVTYDFMTSARARLFIDLAPPIERPATLAADVLDGLLRERWLRAARFSMTQLAARFLVEAEHDGGGFTADDLAEAVTGQATTLDALGRHVDARLLHAADARRLATSYLNYARRHRLVKTIGDGGWSATKEATEITVGYEEVGYRAAPLAYTWNELREMLSVEPSVAPPPYRPAQRIIAWTEPFHSAAPAR